MNIDEAYEILGVNKNSSEEEINKAYKKMVLLHHPDKNKDSKESEIKLKEINEAKKIIDDPPQEFGDFDGMGINFPDVQMRPRQYPEPIINVHMTFMEAALGVKKTITYDRYDKCSSCDGKGLLFKKETCKTCDGKKYRVVRQGQMQAVMACGSCHGSGKDLELCKICNGAAVAKVSMTEKVEMPVGIHDGQILKIPNAGNYIGENRGLINSLINRIVSQKHYGSAAVLFSIDKDDDMRFDKDGENILSDLNLTLLEALKGTNKKVKTINGDLTLKVRPNVKSGATIVASGLGPGRRGNHIFNVNVEYPEDTKELIEFLERE